MGIKESRLMCKLEKLRLDAHSLVQQLWMRAVDYSQGEDNTPLSFEEHNFLIAAFQNIGNMCQPVTDCTTDDLQLIQTLATIASHYDHEHLLENVGYGIDFFDKVEAELENRGFCFMTL